MINGILNVNKEKDFTSHDVVAKLRGILKQKKIGHTGTLDPDATGVLPVCLGNGTKLCDMLTDRSKEYETVLLLGQTTDTEDTSGKILTTLEVEKNEEELTKIIQSFEGGYDQIPPMYSALKVNGKKLYELAREGKVIERQPRHVEILKIRILSMELPRIRLAVSCSKGTYIRSLCRDIGEKAGCGGCMEELIRTRVGEFRIEDSLTLAQVEAIVKEERILKVIKKVDDVFLEYPAAKVKEEFYRFICNGNKLEKQYLEKKEIAVKDGDWIRIYDHTSRFMGIYRYDNKENRFIPVKMFL